MGITTVAVPTKDRLSSLTRCLESYLANAQRHGRSPEWLVSDDSACCPKQTKAMLQRLSAQFGATLRYANHHSKRQFMEALVVRSGVAPDVVRFALFGDDRCERTTGANRNGVLLETAGEQILSVDDDTVCQMSTRPDFADHGAFSPAYDPTEFWFWPDLHACDVDVDVLRGHEYWLGSTGVVMTLNGWLGDCAMPSPRYGFSLTGASRERFLAAYPSPLEIREVLRVVRQPTVTPGPFSMFTFFGLDNTALVPPCFPVERNADSVFGLMREQVLQGSRVAFLPWALLHAPDPPRRFAPDDLWDVSPRMCDLVMAAVMSHRFRAEAVTPDTRMVDLGQHLQRLGAMPVDECEARLRIPHEFRRLGLAVSLEKHLLSDGVSRCWADDMRRLIGALDASVGKPLVPRDLTGGLDHAQELIGRFGQVCEAWAAMVEAARRLKADGVRLSTPIGV
jgi:hypothetical protein